MTIVVPNPGGTASLTIKKDRSGKYKGASRKPPTIAQLMKLSEAMAFNRIGMTDTRECVSRTPRPVGAPMSLQDYTKLLAEIKTYNTLLEKKWNPNMIRRLGATLHQKISVMIGAVDVSRMDSAYYIYAAQKELGHVAWAVHPRSIFTELVTICQTFETFWSSTRKALNVITPPIVVLHPVIRGLRYNFGPAIIQIGPTYDTNSISPHTPRWSRGRNNEYFHPHVRGGNDGALCRGEGGTAIARAAKEGRYFDVVDMTIAILSTYGSNPYMRIEEWNGICDEKFDPQTGRMLAADEIIPEEVRPTSTCGGCGVVHDNPVSCYHSGCQYQNVCIGCLTRCTAILPNGQRCNNWHCEEHIWICSNCGRRMCNSHFTLDDSAEVCDDCYEEDE